MALITVPKAKCFQCENTFPIQSLRLDNDVVCPYCGSVMDTKTKQDVVNAIECLKEVNGNFQKYHEERQEPLFQVSAEVKEVDLPFDKN